MTKEDKKKTEENSDRVARQSADIKNENLQKLQEAFPQFIKDGEIDFDALQAFFKKEGILAGEEKYGLNWAGKSNAFKLIRTTATGTLKPVKEESIDWDKTENLFVEGDNLEVLKLLQKHYRGKIKMIYIDPPYNTGKDFIYKDDYTEDKSNYYERTGQTEGGIKLTSNPESAGRYHSDWLTMMYPRLFLGRNLLKNDGVIFVSIDDNEVHNLRHIMDEIFGEENFLGIITVVNNLKGRSDDDFIATANDYLVVYAKSQDDYNMGGFPLSQDQLDEYNKEDEFGLFKEVGFRKTGKGWRRKDRPNMFYPVYFNPKSRSISLSKKTGYRKILPLNSKGEEGRWRWEKQTFKERYKKDILIRKVRTGEWRIFTKMRIEEEDGEERTLLPKSVWIDPRYDTAKGGKMVRGLFKTSSDYFDNPKPVELLKDILRISTVENSLVLDFFAGSATLAHAVMDLNAECQEDRKYILAQLPELTGEDSEARKKGHNTIADISKERIRRARNKVLEKYEEEVKERENPLDVGFKVFKLSISNYRRWNFIHAEDEQEELLEQEKLFVEQPLIDDHNEIDVVYEIILKEGFDMNSIIKKQNGDLNVWIVNDADRKIYISFVDDISKKQVEALGLREGDVFVCFDSALDDTTKINLARNFDVRVI